MHFPLLTNCLCVNLKSCFVLLNASSRSARCRHVSVSIFLALVCSKPRVALLVVDSTVWIFLASFCLTPRVTLFMPLRGRFVSVSIFLALFCLTPQVALLVVDVVSTVSTFLNTSTRSGYCSDVSNSFVNTLTFVELVLVSFSPLCRSNLLLLMFHSPKLLQYFDIYLIAFKSFSVLLLFVLLFNIAVPNLRTPSQKGDQ